MEYRDARLRNLKIKLYKGSLTKGKMLDRHYTKESINKILFFKKSDINEYINVLFDTLDDEEYSIKKEVIGEIEKYFSEYTRYEPELKELEDKLETNYKKIKDIFMNFKPTHNAQEIINETKGIAAKLHWIYTPIYTEQTILNREIIPEENTEEYYDHFHTIEDLYRVIFENKEIAWNSLEGDINLNSPMKFRVYSSRWGHEDIYTVKRTEKGWNFKHLSYNVNCLKNGTISGEKKDGFYAILQHDSIQYPYDGVEYALVTLWNEADTSSMTVKDLEKKLQDIGDWISAVEKATKNYQPKWVGYY
ncbi:hypothetical protein ACNRWW_01460 [Metabacillus sp. HB246100]